MTIRYIDFVNGNNSNSGLSWALAKQTLASTPVVAGDEVRFAKSPDPISIGNATWTNASNVITTASNICAMIDDCETVWTAGVGATSVALNSSTKRVGTNGVSIVKNTTTGQVAYKNLGSVKDLSAYTRVSFFLYFSTGNINFGSSGLFTINLCSDTAGTVVVNSLPLPSFFYTAAGLMPVVLDYGSALGNNIQSISINTTSTAGLTIIVDNFTATGPASSSSSVSLWDLVAKNDGLGRYWNIMGLDTNKIYLCSIGMTSGTIAVTNYMYYEKNATTETVDTVKRTPVDITQLGAFAGSTTVFMNLTGNSTTTTTYTGGYNTSSGVIDGETWMAAFSYAGVLINAGPNTSFSINNFGLVRGYQGLALSNLTSNISNISLVDNYLYGFYFFQNANTLAATSLNYASYSVSIKWLLNTSNTQSFFTGSCGLADYSQSSPGFAISIANLHASSSVYVNPTNFNFSVTDTAIVTTSMFMNSNANSAGCNIGSSKITFNNLHNPISNQPISVGGQGCMERPLIVNITGKYGALSTSSNGAMPSYNGGGNVILNGVGANAQIVNNGTNMFGSASIALNSAQNVTVKNMAHANSSATFTYNGSVSVRSNLVFKDFNKTAGDARIYNLWFNGTYWQHQSSVSHSGSKAWKLTHVDISKPRVRATLKIAEILVAANKLVAATIWVRRDTTTTGMEFYTLPNIVAGANTTPAQASAGATAWEQLTLTFTPTEEGVVTFEVAGWYTSGATGQVAYVDDFSITQAA